MIVEMGVCLEISVPVAVIFIEKCLLLALSLTPTSLAAAMSCPRVSGVQAWTLAPDKAASELGTVAIRTWLHRVRVICGAQLVNARSEKRETSNDGPVSIIQSSCLDV